MNKYTGTFRKSDGTTRTMEFITESDARSHFGTTGTIDTGTRTSIGFANESGRVLVYDVVAGGWRYFNTTTQLGEVITETSFFMNDIGSTRH